MAKSKTVVQGAPSMHHNPYNRFGKSYNALAREFLKQSGTPENRALIADLERFEADINDGQKWQGMKPVERDQLQERALHELAMNHWHRCAQSREKLEHEYDQFRASWERTHRIDGAARLANMAHYKTRLKLDSPEKIEGELFAAANASTPEERAQFDPDRLYAMAEIAADSGKPGTLEVAKQALSNCNVDAPWLNDPKGAALAAAIDEVTTEYGLAKSDGGEIVAEIAELVTN